MLTAQTHPNLTKALTLDKSSHRIELLDLLRGFAIILMIIFHFSYDLNYFHFLTLNTNEEPFFRYFRFTILTLFISISAVSLSLAYRNKIDNKKLVKRVGQLGFAALLVTAVSLFLFEKSWIYFGILHFLLFATLITLPLLHYKKTLFTLGAVIIVLSHYDVISVRVLFNFFQPLFNLPMHTEDVVRLTPWLGLYFIATTFTTIIITINKKIHTDKKVLKVIKFTGRHSLIIYLIHQPILFGLLSLISYLI